MISKRLKSIALFVSTNDEVVDVGCDHGLLSIYLYENKLCKKVIASDINSNALNNAINNIKKYKYDIETILSDGLDNIDTTKLNTIIISGMGTSTILHILKDTKKLDNINNLIIQSNNEHEILRINLNKIGYYLIDEDIVYDNKKYYITMKFIKSNKLNTDIEYKYGIIKDKNIDYYKYLNNKKIEILSKIPFKRILLRKKLKKEIKYLNNIIEKM